VGWGRVGWGNAWLIFQPFVTYIYFVIMTVMSTNLCRCGYDFVHSFTSASLHAALYVEIAIMQYSLVFTISL